MFKTGLANISLRALTLAAKFLLLLGIARYLSPEELGIWGLMNVTITIALYFLGLDFYTFNTREILAQNEADRTPLIRDQIVFHALVYIIILPLLSVVFVNGLIPWRYAPWFYLLLILEHLSQEATRLLITLSRPTMANAVLFLRSGSWIFAVVALFSIDGDARRLPVVWLGWTIGVFSSLTLTVWVLRHLPWKKSRQVAIDWTWMRRGVGVALPFFGATLSFVGIQYVDRYFLQSFWGEATVGIYTFYSGLANVIHAFIFSGIIMILYPQVIAAYQQGDFVRYRLLMRKMSLGVIGGLAILSALALLLIRPVLHLVDRPVYTDQITVFIILLGSVSMMTLSYLPHYALYVKRQDRAIIVAALTGLVVALAANAILVPRYGLNGAAMATLSALTAMTLVKVTVVLKRSHTGAAFLRPDALTAHLRNQQGGISRPKAPEKGAG